MKATRVPIVLLTIGSPHGDDQVGWVFAEHFREEAASLGVKCVCLRTPLELLDHVQNCVAVILVDACQSGAEVGSVFRFSWPACSFEAQSGSSSHGLGVQEALQLAQALNLLPRKVTLLAVEVQHCQPAAAMTACVRKALPKLAELVREEVNQTHMEEQKRWARTKRGQIHVPGTAFGASQ